MQKTKEIREEGLRHATAQCICRGVGDLKQPVMKSGECTDHCQRTETSDYASHVLRHMRIAQEPVKVH